MDSDSDSQKTTHPSGEYLGGQILGILFSLIAIVESLPSNQIGVAKNNLEFVSRAMADFQKENEISPVAALGHKSVVNSLMESIKHEQERRARHSSKSEGGFFSSLHLPRTAPKKETARSSATRT